MLASRESEHELTSQAANLSDLIKKTVHVIEQYKVNREKSALQFHKDNMSAICEWIDEANNNTKIIKWNTPLWKLRIEKKIHKLRRDISSLTTAAKEKSKITSIFNGNTCFKNQALSVQLKLQGNE